jgi:CheY-like chemotaxis protein
MTLVEAQALVRTPKDGAPMDTSMKITDVQKDSWFSLYLWPAFRRLLLLDDKLCCSRAVLRDPLTSRHLRFSSSRSRERADPYHKLRVQAQELTCKNTLMKEGHQNKLMDDLHCPLGLLREEAQKTTAIGLRIAMDNLRLRWTERAQMAYEEAKKSASEALSAWNGHISHCEICRDAKPGLAPARTNSGFVTAPTVMLVAQNPEVLELLVAMLEPTHKIAAALCSGTAVVAQAAALLPDLIILDMSLADISGFEVAKRLKRAGCRAKIIFLSLHEDIDFAGAAFGLGASGYVLTSRVITDLENAIATVLTGGQFSSIR